VHRGRLPDARPTTEQGQRTEGDTVFHEPFPCLLGHLVEARQDIGRQSRLVVELLDLPLYFPQLLASFRRVVKFGRFGVELAAFPLERDRLDLARQVPDPDGCGLAFGKVNQRSRAANEGELSAPFEISGNGGMIDKPFAVGVGSDARLENVPAFRRQVRVVKDLQHVRDAGRSGAAGTATRVQPGLMLPTSLPPMPS